LEWIRTTPDADGISLNKPPRCRAVGPHPALQQAGFLVGESSGESEVLTQRIYTLSSAATRNGEGTIWVISIAHSFRLIGVSDLHHGPKRVFVVERARGLGRVAVAVEVQYVGLLEHEDVVESLTENEA